MGEFVLLTVVLLVLFSYIRYLLKYPEDFTNYYCRINYYKPTLEIE